MAETHETVADVIAAMRDEGRTGESSCLEWVGAKMRDYADRLEAAHRRERGNCAKLREALMYLFNLIDMRKLVLDCDETEEISAVQVMLDECRAALSAPLRNCDRFASAEEAWDAYDEWADSYRAQGKTEPFNEVGWLFATATEKKGENNGH